MSFPVLFTNILKDKKMLIKQIFGLSFGPQSSLENKVAF
jgi:hypothetical protein